MAEPIEHSAHSDRGDGSDGDRSPFEPARITEGYPFDEQDQKVIKRLLSDIRRRQRDAARKALTQASDS